jgi:hypothetical protein
MGFRFRRSIRLLPGVRLNFSKGGVSASVGKRGATVNVGKRGVRATVGLPGTGLSYSERIDTQGEARREALPPRPVRTGSPWPVLVVVAFVAGMIVAMMMMR